MWVRLNAAISTVFAACFSISTLATTQPADTPPILDIPYHEARKQILSDGWQPVRSISPGTPIDDIGYVAHSYLRRGYNEVVGCSMSGATPCAFRFHKDGATLNVYTLGEEGDGYFAMVSSVELDQGGTANIQRAETTKLPFPRDHASFGEAILGYKVNLDLDNQLGELLIAQYHVMRENPSIQNAAAAIAQTIKEHRLSADQCKYANSLVATKGTNAACPSSDPFIYASGEFCRQAVGWTLITHETINTLNAVGEAESAEGMHRGLVQSIEKKGLRPLSVNASNSRLLEARLAQRMLRDSYDYVAQVSIDTCTAAAKMVLQEQGIEERAWPTYLPRIHKREFRPTLEKAY